MLTVLRGKLGLGVIALVLLIAGQAAVTRALVGDTATQINQAHDVDVEAALLGNRIKFDAVQVQQWLTDVSATRGLDGLNDGFDVAAEFAEDFRAAVDELEALRPELAGELDEMRTVFEEYHQVGIAMATAYVADGPSSGNVMMGEFDAAAAAIGASVDALVEDLLVDADASLTGAEQSAERVAAVSTIAAVAIAVIALVVGASLLMWMVSRVRLFADAASEIASGQMNVASPGLGDNGVFGELSRSFDEMTLMLAAAGKQAEEIATGNISAHSGVPGELGETFAAMSTSLGAMVDKLRSTSERLADRADELLVVSSTVGESAERTATRAADASGAGDEVSHRVTAVAGAVEEMNVTIRDVADNAGRSAEVAAEAVEVAKTTSVAISKLGESSEEIGNILRVISSIAEQTNLLALNATIEAARAGESGKGFAVVANEVKELANQTAAATNHISEQITAIQSDTASAVNASERVGETIERINDISMSIASTVDQQSHAANEIGRNMQDAATSSQTIAGSIGDVASAAAETRRSTDETRSAADSMKNMSSELKELVSMYR